VDTTSVASINGQACSGCSCHGQRRNSKNSVSTNLPRARRNRIAMALLRQSLRRGEYVIWWVPSRANLSDPFTKEIMAGPSPLSPSLILKQPLLDALRSNNRNLKGVKRITRTKEDVSR
jgi:hypothetical protein